MPPLTTVGQHGTLQGGLLKQMESFGPKNRSIITQPVLDTAGASLTNTDGGDAEDWPQWERPAGLVDHPRAWVFPELRELDEMRRNPNGSISRFRNWDIIWAASAIEASSTVMFRRLREETDALLLRYMSVSRLKDYQPVAAFLDRPGDRLRHFTPGRDDDYYLNLLDPTVIELVARWEVSECVRGQYNGFAFDNFGIGTARLVGQGDNAEAYGMGILALADMVHDLTAHLGLTYVANHNVPPVGDKRWMDELLARPWLDVMYEGDNAQYTDAARDAYRRHIDNGQTVWLIAYEDGTEAMAAQAAERYVWWLENVYAYDSDHALFSIESRPWDGVATPYPGEPGYRWGAGED